MNARNEGYSGARNEVGTPSIGSYSLTVEKSKSTKEASRDRSSCAYQRNPFPATILRASISYWNISSRPMPNPRARMTGIRRRTSATMKIWNAKDLNINTDGADFTFILAIRVFLCKHGYSAKVSVGCIHFSRLPAKPFESGHYVIRPKQPAWLAHVGVSSRVLAVSWGDVQRC